MQEGTRFVTMRRAMRMPTMTSTELLALRRRAGLHIFRAAELLRVSALHLSRCERGEAVASPELAAFAQVTYGADRA